jgi:hypothetical protein
VVRPALLMSFFLIAPFLIWSWITAGNELSLGAGFLALLHKLTHTNELFEAEGGKGGAIMLGSIVASLGIAVFMAYRVPWPLYLDLLDRKVESREGRVVAREETINRPNGRDPIEKYFFSLRHLNMPVNLAAYRALENGSIYIIYVTPRSEILVSIEPKIDDAAVLPSAQPQLHGTEETPSPSGRVV